MAQINNSFIHTKKLPLIYHEKYNISLSGIEKIASFFDTQKYSKIYRYINKELSLSPDQWFTPKKITDEQLLAIHTRDYLDSLHQSATIARIAEVFFLKWFPNVLLQKRILDPMRFATSGTILAAELAMHYGWAINIGGGYHHAKANEGGGFCIYADIPLAVHTLRKKNPDISVMIVDLDAHQGNGYASIFKKDPKIHIFDMYNKTIYPHDKEAENYIAFNIPLPAGINDTEYLTLLKNELPRAIDSAKPDLVIYNAGTDILSGDWLGCMNISPEGIIKRDAFVFSICKEKKIPIAMVLSGGYTKKSASIIGQSIVNIVQNMVNQ